MQGEARIQLIEKFKLPEIIVSTRFSQLGRGSCQVIRIKGFGRDIQ